MMTARQVATEQAADQMLAIENELAVGKLIFEQLPELITRLEAGEGSARLNAEAARLVVARLQAMLPPKPVAPAVVGAARVALQATDGDLVATGKIWVGGSHKRVYWSFSRAGIAQAGVKACWDCQAGKWLEKKNIKFFAELMPAIEAASKAA